jgi:hypothetical protein
MAGIAQALEHHPPWKCGALSSNLSTVKNLYESTKEVGKKQSYTREKMSRTIGIKLPLKQTVFKLLIFILGQLLQEKILCVF